jgi:hypothetical protein
MCVQFAHGESDLRRRQIRHPKYKTEKCKTYWNQGFCPYGSRCMFIHDESTDEIETFKTRNLTRTTSREPTAQSGSKLNPHAGLFTAMCPPADMPTSMSPDMFFQQVQQQQQQHVPQIPVQATYSQMLFVKQPDAKIQSSWPPRETSTGSTQQVPSGVSKIETAWRPRQVSSESTASSDSKNETTSKTTVWPPREVSSSSSSSLSKPKEKIVRKKTTIKVESTSSESPSSPDVTTRDNSVDNIKKEEDTASSPAFDEDDDGSTIEERLNKLTSLREKGTLTEIEYTAAKSAVMALDF